MKSKLKIILISVFSLSVVLFGGAIYYVSQKVNSEEIRELTIKQIQNTFPAAKVELGKFDLSLGTRIKLTADNLNISYPTKRKSYNMLSVKDLTVKVPIWSILTGGGSIDVNLDSPKVGYYELKNGTNWSLSTKGGKKKTAPVKPSTKTKKEESKAKSVEANQLVIPAFIANSNVNLRLKNILLDYAMKPKTKGTVEINKFIVTNLGLKSKAAFELDSKIILGQKKASDVSFRSLIIGEFSLSEFLKNNKIDSNIVLKISDVFLKDSNLKLPLLKNNIEFSMNGGNISGNVKTNFEKSTLGFDYSVGGSKVLVSNLKSDIKLQDLLNIANDPTLPVSAKSASLNLGGGVSIKNSVITPNLSIDMKNPLTVNHQGLNADVIMSGSVKGSKTNLKVSTSVLEGVIDLLVATNFNLNSKKPVQSRLKNTVVSVDISSVNITKQMLQDIIYAPKKEDSNTSNEEASKTASSSKAKEPQKKGTAFVLPNAKINLNWNKVKVGTEETKGLVKVNVNNNVIKTNKYTINFGKGTIKGNESLTLGKTSTKGSFNLALNKIQFDSFQAMLPPQVTEVKGNFSGKINGKFFSGDKVTYDVTTKLKAANGDLKGIDVNQYVQKVYGLVEKLSFLKGKMPKKDVKVDGNFEIFELDGRFKHNHFDLKKVNFVGVNKKVMMKGSGNIYPLPSKKEGRVFIDFKDQLGLSKVMKKNVGTETMPLLFKGSGYALSPDYGFTAKKLAKVAYKSKGKKQVKKAVNKLKKKIFKTDDKKKVEEKLKNEAKKLFKGFF